MAINILDRPTAGGRIGAALGGGIQKGVDLLMQQKMRDLQRNEDFQRKMDFEQLRQRGQKERDAQRIDRKAMHDQDLALLQSAIKQKLKAGEMPPPEVIRAMGIRHEDAVNVIQQIGQSNPDQAWKYINQYMERVPAMKEAGLYPDEQVPATTPTTTPQPTQAPTPETPPTPTQAGPVSLPSEAPLLEPATPPAAATPPTPTPETPPTPTAEAAPPPPPPEDEPKTKPDTKRVTLADLNTLPTAKEMEEKRINALKDSRPYRDAVFQRETTNMKIQHTIKEMKKLNEEDELGSSIYHKFLDFLNVSDVGDLVSPDAQRWRKLEGVFLSKLKDLFGGRITNLEMENYRKTLPTLLNTKEGRELVLRDMELAVEAENAEANIIREIKEEHHGKYPEEGDLNAEVNKRLGPKLERIYGQFSSALKPAESDERKISEIIEGKSLAAGETVSRNGIQWRKTPTGWKRVK